MQGARSLAEARERTWPQMSDTEIDQFRDRLTEVLTTGDFHFVAVAQRFTQSMENTVRYLNQTIKRGSFYLVEMIRYQSAPADRPGEHTLNAYAGQLIARPERQPMSPSTRIDEAQLLDSITDPDYRAALQRIFDACRGSGLTFSWGVRGASIRIATQDRAEPLSIGWIFPPDRISNWSGLTNLTLGYDRESLATRPSVKEQIERYGAAVGDLDDALTVRAKAIEGATFAPAGVVKHEVELITLITDTVASISERGQLA